MLLNQSGSGIPREWILLDSCLTDYVFNGCSFLSEIVASDDKDALTMASNGNGCMTYYLKSFLKIFPLDVFYHEHSMANIISLFDLVQVKGLIITLNNRVGLGFNVTYKGKLYHFAPYKNGLYYFDTRIGPRSVDADHDGKSKSSVSPHFLLQTVSDNKEFYSAREIQGAERARIQQEELGWPSDTFYKHIIKENLLTNTEVTIDDVHRAEHIFRPAKPLLQGTMTQQKPSSTKIEKIPLPLPISIHHSSVSLSVDFFYVNGHVFFMSKSSKLNFTTAKYHKSRSMKSIINSLNDIRQLYSSRGFRIENIHGDNEFNKEEIKKSQLPALFHIYGKDKHVGLIERSNQMVKNKARTMTHAAPYQYIPKVMVIGFITEAAKWINAFPSMNGISKTMSPATIVQGVPKPNMKYKRIVFGAYAMVYSGTNNKLDARSVPVIALNSSNEHGGHYFMSLYSGKRIHSYEWKEIPIDEEVIQRVEELAMEEEATEMKRGYPVFTWKRRFLDDPELNVNDADDDNRSEILPGDNLDDNINNDVEEDNDDEEQIEQHLIVPNNENDDFED